MPVLFLRADLIGTALRSGWNPPAVPPVVSSLGLLLGSRLLGGPPPPNVKVGAASGSSPVMIGWLLPLLVANAFTIWFCLRFMRDEPMEVLPEDE